jgi:hypothetical protein
MDEGYSVILLIGGIFTLVFGGIGLGFFLKYMSSKRKAEASKSWPSTAGTIEASTITSNTSTDSDGFSSTTYAPVVIYSYNAMGSTFHGRRVGFGMEISGSQSGAVNTMSRYPVGKIVTVYYNPENPGEAVLEQSVINNMLTIIFFSVFGGVGIVACLVSGWILASRFLK